jgi:hypothetical protein
MLFRTGLVRAPDNQNTLPIEFAKAFVDLAAQAGADL